MVGTGVITATTLAFAPGVLSTDVGYKFNTAVYSDMQPRLPPLYTKASFGDQ